jgi:hypothetical protein
MHLRPGGIAGNGKRLAAGGADLVVGRHCKLEDHMRALVEDATEMAGMVASGLRSAEADINSDPCGPQFGVPLPGNFRVGILDGRYDAGNARCDHRIHARRRLANMRTGLERHVKRGATRGLARAPQRLRLGVRPAAWLSPATPDDDAIPHDDSAHGRIGPGASLPAPAERQRQLHVALVGRLGIPDFLRELVFQDTEDHLRIVASRLSSSPWSSPSTVSKSLASRKLR